MPIAGPGTGTDRPVTKTLVPERPWTSPRRAARPPPARPGRPPAPRSRPAAAPKPAVPPAALRRPAGPPLGPRTKLPPPRVRCPRDDRACPRGRTGFPTPLAGLVSPGQPGRPALPAWPASWEQAGFPGPPSWGRQPRSGPRYRGHAASRVGRHVAWRSRVRCPAARPARHRSEAGRPRVWPPACPHPAPCWSRDATAERGRGDKIEPWSARRLLPMVSRRCLSRGHGRVAGFRAAHADLVLG